MSDKMEIIQELDQCFGCDAEFVKIDKKLKIWEAIERSEIEKIEAPNTEVIPKYLSGWHWKETAGSRQMVYKIEPYPNWLCSKYSQPERDGKYSWRICLGGSQRRCWGGVIVTDEPDIDDYEYIKAPNQRAVPEYLDGWYWVRAIVADPDIIDCEKQPAIRGSGWTVKMHIKGGLFKWDPSKIDFYYLHRNKKSCCMPSKRKLIEIYQQPLANSNLLDFLLANQDLIPEEWKALMPVFFGTIQSSPNYGIFSNAISHDYVRSIFFDKHDNRFKGDDWDLHFNSLTYRTPIVIFKDKDFVSSPSLDKLKSFFK